MMYVLFYEADNGDEYEHWQNADVIGIFTDPEKAKEAMKEAFKKDSKWDEKIKIYKIGEEVPKELKSDRELIRDYDETETHIRWTQDIGLDEWTTTISIIEMEENKLVSDWF